MFYIVSGTAALLIGLGKGGLGGMLGAVSTALMSLVMPVAQVVGLLLPMLLLADAFAVSVHWRRWDMRLILRLLPAALLGVLVGTYVITATPPVLLRRVLGIVVLVFLFFRIYEKRILRASVYQSRGWHGLAAGTMSGFGSALAHAGGPPVAMYLLLQKIEPRTFAATLALFFATLNVIKVPTYFYAGVFDFELVSRVVLILPLLPIGVLLGRLLAVRIARELFENVILALLVMAVFLLLLT